MKSETIIEIEKFNNYWIERHQGFISNNKIDSIAKDYENACLYKNIDVGFNLFTLISDTYYKENFHSDILFALLSVRVEGMIRQPVEIFLDYLKELGASLNLRNYNSVVIEREKGRLDLLIFDTISKRCVIIENKINNAPDMDRQIPRYVKYVTEKRGFECECIVYLTLDGNKNPSKINWTSKEVEYIGHRLKSIAAYNDTHKDLYSGWISKLEKSTTHIDILFVLRQYGTLLKKIGGNVMNKIIIESFYKEMLDVEKYKTAQSVKIMLEDLILFRAERIKAFFETSPAPFNNIVVWQNWVVSFNNCNTDDKAHWSIDIGVHSDEYRFEFWNRNAENTNGAKALLERMGVLDNSFYEAGLRMKKQFRFPGQEQEMLDYTVAFKQKLIAALNL